MPPAATKSKIGYFFSIRSRSRTFESFERGSSVEYACQIWSLYLLRLESYGQGKSSFATVTVSRIVTDRHTDRTKTRFPRSHSGSMVDFTEGNVHVKQDSTNQPITDKCISFHWECFQVSTIWMDNRLTGIEPTFAQSLIRSVLN